MHAHYAPHNKKKWRSRVHNAAAPVADDAVFGLTQVGDRDALKPACWTTQQTACGSLRGEEGERAQERRELSSDVWRQTSSSSPGLAGWPVLYDDGGRGGGGVCDYFGAENNTMASKWEAAAPVDRAGSRRAKKKKRWRRSGLMMRKRN